MCSPAFDNVWLAQKEILAALTLINGFPMKRRHAAPFVEKKLS